MTAPNDPRWAEVRSLRRQAENYARHDDTLAAALLDTRATRLAEELRGGVIVVPVIESSGEAAEQFNAILDAYQQQLLGSLDSPVMTGEQPGDRTLYGTPMFGRRGI